MISFALIGYSDFFGFGFTPPNRNAYDCNLIFFYVNLSQKVTMIPLFFVM